MHSTPTRIKTEPFNEQRLRDLLPDLRSLTKAKPEVFEPRVKRELAACGVALVVLPHLPKTYAHGATRWASPEKAIVQLSLRGSWADIFWFTLCHELGHVLCHGRRGVFIQWAKGGRDGREQEADAFASDLPIPRWPTRRSYGAARPCRQRQSWGSPISRASHQASWWVGSSTRKS